MKKQTVLLLLLAGILLTAGGYRAGCHLTQKRLSEAEKTISQQEKRTDDEKLLQEAEEKENGEIAEKNREKEQEENADQMQFLQFEKSLQGYLTDKEQTQVKKELENYLKETNFHQDITQAVCLPYITKEKELISFYIKLSDGLLVAAYFHGNEVMLKETAVTEKLLKQKEAAEKEKQEQQKLSEEAFKRAEGGIPPKTPKTPEETNIPQQPPKKEQETVYANTSVPAEPEREEPEHYPYQFVNFSKFTEYLNTEQIEELKQWICGLLQESKEYQTIPKIEARQFQKENGILTADCILGEKGTLSIEYTEAGEVTMTFDAISLEELR